MADHTEIRERFLSALERSSPETRRVRLFWCDKFLHFAPDSPSHWDKRAVTSFLAHLEKEGYAPLSRRTAFGVVKAVFEAAQKVHEEERERLEEDKRRAVASVDFGSIDPSDPTATAKALKGLGEMQKVLALSVPPGPRWDVGRRVMPRPQAGEMARPALEFEEIRKMVALARGDSLSPAEVAYLALGSVYFLRQGELRAVRREHIDFDKGLIWIDTEKGGQKRNQVLPEALYPYLKAWDFGLDYSPFMMWKMFRGICEKAGVALKPHESWHAFRRYGLTAVRDALASDPAVKRDAQMIAHIFLRWSPVSSSEMSDRYYMELDADRIALEHHPVVPLWS